MTNPEGTPPSVPNKDLFHDIVEEALRRAEDARLTTQTQKATPATTEPTSVFSPTEEIANTHALIDRELAEAQKRRTATMPAVEIPPTDDSPQVESTEETFAEYAKGTSFTLTPEEAQQKLKKLRANQNPKV